MLKTEYKSKELEGKAEGLAKYLGNELEAAYQARSGLKPRWEQNEKQYRNDPSCAGVKLFDNFESRAVPTLSPRVNRIVNTTTESIIRSNPMVQAVPDDRDQDGADALQRGLTTVWNRAGFERVLRRALTTACLCGVSIVRQRMDQSGVKFDHIHPNDFIKAPAYGLDISESHLVGHRFYYPRWKVKQLVRDGHYDRIKEKDVDSLTASLPADDPSGRDPSYDRTDDSIFSRDSDLVELWELTVRLVVDGKPGYCKVVFHRHDQKILLKEDYIYSRPWYFDLRFHDEEGNWWPSSSVAQNIIGLCILQADMFNLLVAGSMATCVNPLVVSGGSLGKKVNTLSLNHVYQTPYDVKVQPIPLQFDPKAMPAAMQFIDKAIEAQTGISERRLITEPRSESPTATQVNAEEGAAQQNESAYPSFVADFVEAMAYQTIEYARMHPSVFRSVYKGALPDLFYAKLYNFVTWEVTGRVPGNAPWIVNQKLNETLMLAAQQPVSGLHYRRTERAVLNAKQLPLNVEGILKTEDEVLEEERQQQAVAQLQLQQAASDASGNGGMVPQG